MELFRIYYNDVINHDGEVLCTMNYKGKIIYISADYKKYKKYYKKMLKLARKATDRPKQPVIVYDSDNVEWLYDATTSPKVKAACALYIDILNSMKDDSTVTSEALTDCRTLINSIIRIEKEVI